MPIIRRVRPVRNKNVVNVEDDERRPARRQAEGKASNKIKATAGPSGVIDRLAPFHPFATLSRARLYALRGGWRPFLLSFNLTFPANGQPGVNSTALIATRQSPTGSVRATERTRGPVHPPSFGVSRVSNAFPPFSASSSIPRNTRFLGCRLSLPVHGTTYGGVYFHAVSASLNVAIGCGAAFAFLMYSATVVSCFAAALPSALPCAFAER